MITYFLSALLHCSEHDLLDEVYLWHFVLLMPQDYGLHKFYVDALKLPLLAVYYDLHNLYAAVLKHPLLAEDYDLLCELCLEHFVGLTLQDHD
eukprot:scaffold36774_cov53-Cyclotella_meneghiniana.AAC.1